MKKQGTYEAYASKTAVKSPLISDCLHAFLVGGLICTFAEGMWLIYTRIGVSEEHVKTLVPVTLIFLAVLLTGLGLFEKVAKFAGGGTLVPITGFANAVASQAIESRAEGYILGVGANMFKIAGPVILYGTAAGTLYGVVYYFTRIM